jgi:hypothetical protein
MDAEESAQVQPGDKKRSLRLFNDGQEFAGQIVDFTAPALRLPEWPLWLGVDFAAPIETAHLFGEFTPEPVTPIDNLAREYYARAEAYDRTVCTGPIRDGSIMPANWREQSLINRHATNLLRELNERAERLGYTRRDLHQAMRKCKQ